MKFSQSISYCSFKTVWFSIIRFRWDYLQSENRQTVNEKGKNVLRNPEYPGFSRFMSQGVHTEYITSVFPSESFPSWQTINTGLFPFSQKRVFNFFKIIFMKIHIFPQLVRTTHNFISNGHGNIQQLYKVYITFLTYPFTNNEVAL